MTIMKICVLYSKKLLQTRKPDSVFTLSFICSANYSAESICLPSGIGRAALGRRYTWHFSMQGLPAVHITAYGRGLLPHIFTFFPREQDSYFLWHFLLLRLLETPGCSPVHLLCAVQTFLTAKRHDSSVCSKSEIKK